MTALPVINQEMGVEDGLKASEGQQGLLVSPPQRGPPEVPSRLGRAMGEKPAGTLGSGGKEVTSFRTVRWRQAVCSQAGASPTLTDLGIQSPHCPHQP